jgi:DNA-binding transcriptional ArsR family regulator
VQASVSENGAAAAVEAPVYRLKADLFRLLGHPARVRILELLGDGELSVGELQVALGRDSSGTSQHLTAMRRLGVLDNRRAGTSVFYRVKDPRIFELLRIARQILAAQLEETRDILGDLAGDAVESAPRRKSRVG